MYPVAHIYEVTLQVQPGYVLHFGIEVISYFPADAGGHCGDRIGKSSIFISNKIEKMPRGRHAA